MLLSDALFPQAQAVVTEAGRSAQGCSTDAINAINRAMVLADVAKARLADVRSRIPAVSIGALLDMGGQQVRNAVDERLQQIAQRAATGAVQAASAYGIGFAQRKAQFLIAGVNMFMSAPADLLTGVHADLLSRTSRHLGGVRQNIAAIKSELIQISTLFDQIPTPPLDPERLPTASTSFVRASELILKAATALSADSALGMAPAAALLATASGALLTGDERQAATSGVLSQWSADLVSGGLIDRIEEIVASAGRIPGLIDKANAEYKKAEGWLKLAEKLPETFGVLIDFQIAPGIATQSATRCTAKLQAIGAAVNARALAPPPTNGNDRAELYAFCVAKTAEIEVIKSELATIANLPITTPRMEPPTTAFDDIAVQLVTGPQGRAVLTEFAFLSRAITEEVQRTNAFTSDLPLFGRVVQSLDVADSLLAQMDAAVAAMAAPESGGPAWTAALQMLRESGLEDPVAAIATGGIGDAVLRAQSFIGAAKSAQSAVRALRSGQSLEVLPGIQGVVNVACQGAQALRNSGLADTLVERTELAVQGEARLAILKGTTPFDAIADSERIAGLRSLGLLRVMAATSGLRTPPE